MMKILVLLLCLMMAFPTYAESERKKVEQEEVPEGVELVVIGAALLFLAPIMIIAGARTTEGTAKLLRKARVKWRKHVEVKIMPEKKPGGGKAGSDTVADEQGL